VRRRAEASVRALLIALIAVIAGTVAGADPAALLARDAARDLDAGRAAFVRADAADIVGDETAATAALRQARRQLASAMAHCRAVLAAAPDDTTAQDVLAAAAAVGRTCCGRQSLWERYGVSADER